MVVMEEKQEARLDCVMTAAQRVVTRAQLVAEVEEVINKLAYEVRL